MVFKKYFLHSKEHFFKGLHACGNMAFVKEFEAFQQYNNDYTGSGQNSQSIPDVVGGGDN